MKKLLGILGAIGMVATSASTVVSCGNKGETDYKLDLTSKEYDTLGEIRAYIMSENGEGTEVGFFLSIDSAKTMYDAANKDNDGIEAIEAAMDDGASFEEKYGSDTPISDLEAFAYFASSFNDNDEPTNPVYGTITNSAK
jgi:hypothetical protein